MEKVGESKLGGLLTLKKSRKAGYFLYPVQRLFARVEWSKLLWALGAFFAARASLLGEVAPFGLIYWALILRFQPEKRYPVTAGIILGWVTSSPGVFPPWMLPASMFAWKAIDTFLKRFIKNSIFYSLSITLPLSLLILRIPFFLHHGFTVYEGVIAVMEISITALLPALIVPFIKEMQLKTKPSIEALVGGGLLLSIIFLGMKGINVMEGISLLKIIAPFVVLLGAYLYGAFWGLGAGAIVGLCLSFGTPEFFPFTGALGIAGLAAGLLNSYSRLWVGAGYFLLLRFFSLYGREGGFMLTGLWEELAAVLLFLLLPTSILHLVKELNYPGLFTLGRRERPEVETARRLNEFSAVFKELAAAFRPFNQAETAQEKEDLSPLVDYFSRKICRRCDYFNRCWQNDYRNHHHRVLAMISAGEENSRFSQNMIPVKLRRYCPRQKEIVKAMGGIKDLYYLNSRWHNKIEEARYFVSQQLEGLAEVITGLPQELQLEQNTGDELEQGEPISFTANVGVAQVAKEGQSISGDSYSVLPLRKGKQAVLLSDGMGSGKEARTASRSTVKLIEHLLRLGYSREMVISTINTLLRLRYPGEKFATLELAMIDLCSGKVELYKMGAPPSLMKKGSEVEIMGAGSLPIGILEDVTPEKKSFYFSDKGLLIMVTDGIWNCFPGDGDEHFLRTVKELYHDHPQLIADRLIEEACHRCSEGAVDDLTVVVCSVEAFR